MKQFYFRYLLRIWCPASNAVMTFSWYSFQLKRILAFVTKKVPNSVFRLLEGVSMKFNLIIHVRGENVYWKLHISVKYKEEMMYYCGLNWKSSVHIKETLCHSDSQLSYALKYPAVPELTVYPYQLLPVIILPYPQKYLVIVACTTKPRITKIILKLYKMRIYWKKTRLEIQTMKISETNTCLL